MTLFSFYIFDHHNHVFARLRCSSSFFSLSDSHFTSFFLNLPLLIRISYTVVFSQLDYLIAVEQAAAVSTIRATKDIQAAYAVPCDVNGKDAACLN